VIVCQCTHLSRFTAGEGLLPEDPEPPPPTPPTPTDEEDDDEDKDDILPFMPAFSGFYALCIVVTWVACRKKRGAED
jgi:hypothetical protein